MSDIAEVYLTEGAQKDIRDVARSNPSQANRIRDKITLLERYGWQQAQEVGLLGKLAGHSLFELRVLGKGPAFRLLCDQIAGRSGRIVIIGCCIRKGKVIGKALNRAVGRAEYGISDWLNNHGDLLP